MPLNKQLLEEKQNEETLMKNVVFIGCTHFFVDGVFGKRLGQQGSPKKSHS